MRKRIIASAGIAALAGGLAFGAASIVGDAQTAPHHSAPAASIVGDHHTIHAEWVMYYDIHR